MSLRPCLFLTLLFVSNASAQVWEACDIPATLAGELPGDQFGFVVRPAGDVDGDGLMDFTVGAPGNDAGGQNAGRVYVYSGAGAVLLHTFTGPQAGAAMGYMTIGAGDVDGDGHDDVICGAPDTTAATEGSAWLYSGATGSLIHTIAGESVGSYFGQVVNEVGDLDGDGKGEFEVSAPRFSGIDFERGRVYLYDGATGNLLVTHDGDNSGDRFGAGFTPIGDRNLDGVMDYVIGAPQAGPSSGGLAYVYDGATHSRVGTLSPGNLAMNYALYMMNRIGDVNLDGVEDFFVGDFNHNQGRGRVYAYSGATLELLWRQTGDNPGDTFGVGPGGAGDIDGDGIPDLCFGTLGSDTAATEGGGMTLVRGHDGAILGKYNATVPNIGLGFTVTGLDDVTGDGQPDFLMGTPNSNQGRGIIHLISGAPRPPAQFCDTTPNSAGSGALMEYRRSASVTGNDFRLRVEGAVAGEFGQFVYFQEGASMPFGLGVLCATPPFFRIDVPTNVSASGSKQLALDLTTGAPSQGPGMIVAGATWGFTFLYRDSVGGGTNASNGLRVTFCP